MIKEIIKQIVILKLTFVSKLLLWRFKPRIIGVTGSVGKTSTKDAIYEVMKKDFSVRKNKKSYNAELGVPLTIIGRDNAWHNPFGWAWNITYGFLYFVFGRTFPKWLVLEIGADRPGDIQKIIKWVRPEISIITGIGVDTPVHSEFFESIADLVQEKGHLAEVVPHVGTVILNRDDERVWDIRKRVKGKIVSYGFHPDADLRLSNFHVQHKKGRPTGLIFRADWRGQSVPLVIEGSLGKGQIYAFAAALCVGQELGQNLVEMTQALKDYESPHGRGLLLNGIKDSVIVDESYNSSPVALKGAIENFNMIKIDGRKIAVFGDMTELGKNTKLEHEKIAELLISRVDTIFAVGNRMKFLVAYLEQAKYGRKLKVPRTRWFHDSVECGIALAKYIKKNDAILVKGSQATRMEKVVENIIRDKRDTNKLVRQEREWKNI